MQNSTSQSSRLRALINEAELVIQGKRQEIRDAEAVQIHLRRQIFLLERINLEEAAHTGDIMQMLSMLHLPKAVPINSSLKPTSYLVHLDALPLTLADYTPDLMSRIKQQTYGDFIHVFKEAISICQSGVIECLVHGEDSPKWEQLKARILKFVYFNFARACMTAPSDRVKILSLNFETEDYYSVIPQGARA
jgi:hypothetical protein